ncbi:DUF615 domain-containing protein [Ruegeria sp. Ofav3-42]|uniref:DUF615 domain-containing protein n=1 Tax=Ruegeria sp. Ofav3-42 TaxID=2917759 RepID=UPI001EF58E27|nr:DUF615 domain-containing protein [Ruegeria sp. Ofav3-42]MCG7520552.1 DUF615 domain-containing protein [Ruegeria sp. Ofav3-42]
MRILDELITECSFTARKFEKGYSVYRSVPWADLPLESSKLSYPPVEYAKLNRCNLEGQQVLYAANHPSNVFAEQKDLAIGKRFALSKWQLKREAHALLVGFSPKEIDTLVIGSHRGFKSSSDRHAHTIFGKMFRTKGGEYYPNTASIANLLMRIAMPENLGGGECALAYASVEYPNDEVLAVNFTFPKNFVDNHLELVVAEYVEVTSVLDDKVDHKVL